jgi:hypothetical protein
MAAVQELVDCMISNWYSRFQRATFRTILIPLPQPVVDWLVSDGLHMPADSEAVSVRAAMKIIVIHQGHLDCRWPFPPPAEQWRQPSPLTNRAHSWPSPSPQFPKRGPLDQCATEDDYRDGWSSGEDEASSAGSHAVVRSSAMAVPPLRSMHPAGSAALFNPDVNKRPFSPCSANPLLGASSAKRSAARWSAALQPPPPELAALRAQVAAAIAELGGRVVPKLSWSCPKDAVWLSPSASLACTNPDEVLLLLRASDRAAHDLCAALPDAAAAAGVPTPAMQHVLALRRWHDLQPGREFRCFVAAGRLVGASQRDLTQRFDFLRDERRDLEQLLLSFHAKHVDGCALLGRSWLAAALCRYAGSCRCSWLPC